MASSRRAGENGSVDGADAVRDAFQLVAQGLAQLQDALRLQKQEAERNVQEALRLQKQEAKREVQEALRLQKQEAEREMREALRLQEERAAAAMREMKRKLQQKDDAISAKQQRHQETVERLSAMEERTTPPVGSGGVGAFQRLEDRVEKVEASQQSTLQTFMPRVQAVLNRLEQPQLPRASRAASARDAPATGGAAAGGGEGPPSSTPTPTSSGAGHQGAAAYEDIRARQRLQLRVREVVLRMEEAETSPSPLGEQLCTAAEKGRLDDVQRLIDSGADVNYTRQDGFTPLLNAAWELHADVVSLLLQRGADANALDCYGRSALHLAARRKCTSRCVELLLAAGADVDARDADGRTPLHWAAYGNKMKEVRALLAAGARKDLRIWDGSEKNKTPLDLAKVLQVRDLLRL